MCTYRSYQQDIRQGHHSRWTQINKPNAPYSMASLIIGIPLLRRVLCTTNTISIAHSRSFWCLRKRLDCAVEPKLSFPTKPILREELYNVAFPRKCSTILFTLLWEVFGKASNPMLFRIELVPTLLAVFNNFGSSQANLLHRKTIFPTSKHTTYRITPYRPGQPLAETAGLAPVAAYCGRQRIAVPRAGGILPEYRWRAVVLLHYQYEWQRAPNEP